jgi:hypothetical protein
MEKKYENKVKTPVSTVLKTDLVPTKPIEQVISKDNCVLCKGKITLSRETKETRTVNKVPSVIVTKTVTCQKSGCGYVAKFVNGKLV